MAANWTNAQVLTQLNSGSKWNNLTITYAFPASISGINGNWLAGGELAGFRAVDNTQQAYFRLALQNWDDLIPQTFQQTTSASSNIEFGYSSSMSGYAHAYYPSNGSVWFRLSSGTDANNSTSLPMIGFHGFGTVMHELGHALGLDHMGNYNGAGAWVPSSYQDSTVFSIMSYFGPTGPIRSSEVATADWTSSNGVDYEPQTPMINDVLAIQDIYGASTTTRTGGTVYGFSCNITGISAKIYDFTVNLNPILTIFDSGGSDTLNLSGWNAASYIYLEAGVYSSCNNMTNNIVIAYGCQIENAVAGGGNDVLTGNGIANRLEGGIGNDYLNGGAGNDILNGGAGNDTINGGDGTGDTVVYSGVFSSYTISYDAINGLYSIFGAGDGTDVVSGVENFWFSDVSRLANQLLSSDIAAPTLASVTPADNTAGVSPGANFVLNFSEGIQAGSGSFIIYNASGTVAQSIAVTDASQVTISGSTATINPTTDLASGSSYYINIASGVLKDLAGNNYAGITGATAYNFTTVAATAPVLTSMTPADNTSGVSPGANFMLNFSESVQSGTGNFIIYNTNGTIAQSIAVTDASQVTISGSTVTVNPTADLASDSSYYINIASGVLKDFAGNNYAGISGSTAYNFTTVAATAADDYAWSTNTTGAVAVNGAATSGVIEAVNDADLFKVTLSAGTTYVFNLTRTTGGLSDPYLRLYSPNVTLIAYDDDSAGSQNSKITYTATTSGTYYLGALDYGTGTGAYTLSTASADTIAPTLTSLTPADNATGVSSGANFVLNFSESVQAGSGNFLIYNANGSVARTIAVTDTSQVTISGSMVTINPTADLASGSSYYINITSGALKDLAGNNYAGISGSSAYNFTIAVSTTVDDFPWADTTNGLVVVNGAATSGVIESVSDADLFKVTLTAGTTYVFNLARTTGGLNDPYLQLYSPTAELITYDDDSAGSQNAQLTYTASASGTYYLGALDYSTGIGAYTLTASTAPDDYPWATGTSGVVAVNGAATSGVIESVSDADLFKVTLTAGTTYVFNLARTTGGLTDPYLQLYSPGVTLVAYDDDSAGFKNSRIAYKPSTSGTYYLGVSDYSTGTGGYILSVASTGTAGNDTLIGTDADNTLYGLAGNDFLDGGAGDDTMIGGLGNDTYVVDSAANLALGIVGDTITELAGVGSGIDKVKTSLASYTLGVNIENLAYTGTAAFTGTGNAGNNTITGGIGNDIVSGGAGADRLNGGDGNDILDGGAGADTLIGGLGDDTYVVGSAANLALGIVGDTVTELAGAGIDTVQSSISYALGLNLENLTFTGSTNLNGTGNGLSNTLTGNSGNNILNGGAGNDTLDGGAGVDVLLGGLGDDTLIYDSADKINGGAGIDTLKFSGAGIVLDLSLLTAGKITSIEKLDLTGNGINSLLVNKTSLLNLTGPTGHDLYVTGDAGDSVSVSTVTGGWVDAQLSTVGGISYHQYTHITGAVTDHLYVQDTLIQNLV